MGISRHLKLSRMLLCFFFIVIICSIMTACFPTTTQSTETTDSPIDPFHGHHNHHDHHRPSDVHPPFKACKTHAECTCVTGIAVCSHGWCECVIMQEYTNNSTDGDIKNGIDAQVAAQERTELHH